MTKFDLVHEGVVVYPSQLLPANENPGISKPSQEELELREEITKLAKEAEVQGITTALSTIRISF